MVTKSDLQKAAERLTAEARERVAEPPSAEQLRAYALGQLDPSDEARVRDFVLAYPELAHSAATPFPTEGAEPGDADYLPDEEYAAHWAAMQRRIGSRSSSAAPIEAPAVHPMFAATPSVPDAAALAAPRALRFQRRMSFALAATLVLAFGWIALQMQTNRRLTHELTMPRVAEERTLTPDGTRGVGDDFTPLSANADGYLLRPELTEPADYHQYRAEIVDAAVNPPHVIWQAPALPRHSDDTFAILVPRAFLVPGGRYRIRVYGVDGSNQELLASYSIRAR
jgi:hypothetical protein